MILLGIVLLVVGYVMAISILETLGVALIAIGALLWAFGAVSGRTVAGRTHWW